MSPFDSAKFQALLKGLEVTIEPISALERTQRIDAEYFQKHFIATHALVEVKPRSSVAGIASISDGNHFTISDDFVEEGIPYYRGQDVVGHFFIEHAAPNFITEEAYRRPYMVRSHLKSGDVLLSIIGTIGELSLVGSNELGTCSCKLAILRPISVAGEYLAVFLKSTHGRRQIERLTRGAVQKGLILEDMDQLWVCRFSAAFEKKVVHLVRAAKAEYATSWKSQSNAEELLLASLGLSNWSPPEPMGYFASSKAAANAGRLDAQFFAPRIQQLTAKLSSANLRISDVAPTRREKFNPTLPGEFDYIEIGGITPDGAVASTRMQRDEAPSRATWHVREGDVITSTVRPIRRLSALIEPTQAGYVCSSGFVVLMPERTQPEVLLTYLRLPIVCELMDLYTSASMYPAISEADLLRLPFAQPSKNTSDQIQVAVRNARAARKRAAMLLHHAKVAVDVAVEKSEADALLYIKELGI